MIESLYLLAIALIIIIFISCYISQKKIDNTIDNYNNNICIGDSKEKVILTLGNNFTYSVLKDGTEKLVYKIQNSGSLRIKGTGTTQYIPVKKITIKLKDGKVVSKEGLNLDWKTLEKK